LILPGPSKIARAHAATIKKHGGLQVTPDPGRIETALAEALAFHTFRPEADIALMAAVVAYAFAKGHPLPDGNKRVAFFSVKMVLRVNGFEWKPRHEEAKQRMWRLAETSPPQRDQMLEELSIWIRQSCTPLPR
jgi:death-on-curing family protein